jgi:hypothetical protein
MGWGEREVAKVDGVAYLLTLWVASKAEEGGDPDHLASWLSSAQSRRERKP